MIHGLKFIVKIMQCTYLLPRPNPNEIINIILCVSAGLNNSFFRFFGRNIATFEDPWLTGFWWRKLKEGDFLEDRDVDGRLTKKLILNK